jgi:glycosyltransferase involved in cell wall biosynthesis
MFILSRVYGSDSQVKITHISTADSSGGAARSAYRLHAGLRALGLDSRMLVLQKESNDTSVLLFQPPLDGPTRLRRVIKRCLLKLSQKDLVGRPAGATYFSDDRSQHSADALSQVPPSDILHLHWIAGFLDYRDFFRRLPHGLPVVWTLHDMNPFTGGCHFDGGCGKYLEQCGTCPQICSLERHDLSARVWKRKSGALATCSASSMHIVAPSRWLAAEAKKSTLLGRFPITVIPYGVDTENFQPRDRSFARQLFGIPPEARVVLFVADWAGEKRKGLDLLVEAIKEIEDFPDLCVFTIGRNIARQEIGNRSIAIEQIRDELTMSLAYSAADLFVVPSLQDNLPNTALEAFACGIPTVAFAVGGLTDIIRDDETGVLVAPGDVRALRVAIAKMLENPDRLASMAESCRRTALGKYRLEVQARNYVALYESLLQVRAANHMS